MEMVLQPRLKRGGNLGYNGHKHTKGDKVVAICDRNCNIVSPMIFAPGNQNESPLIREAINPLIKIARLVGFDLRGSIMSLDGVYDCRANRKKIFNVGMKPNINPNKRNRKKTKRGCKPMFSPEIFKERFRTIERIFAWKTNSSVFCSALKESAYTLME
ncbi:transposase [Candidatus Odyssella acanthamoebae]|uniref:transposase n=1 Tax=Candidatus Odyssella acanthamoebae TaxID=91604 RepID=UPI001E28F4D6|nr:transposase [Candidatus Paracaedibacter acanthamoebae]